MHAARRIWVAYQSICVYRLVGRSNWTRTNPVQWYWVIAKMRVRVRCPSTVDGAHILPHTLSWHLHHILDMKLLTIILSALCVAFFAVTVPAIGRNAQALPRIWPSWCFYSRRGCPRSVPSLQGNQMKKSQFWGWEDSSFSKWRSVPAWRVSDCVRPPASRY